MGEKITYEKLSLALKIFVVLGWIVIVLDLLIFIAGFIQGFISAI